MGHSMSTMRFIRIFLFSLSLFVASSCDDEKEPPKERHFYMGATPFPYEISETAVNYTYQKLSEGTEIINHHFDNGVPWVESLADDDFNVHVQNDWNFRKSRTPSNHKVYLSVTPINSSRSGLAAYHGEIDNMALPEPWDSYTFNDQNVKTAYLNYCQRIIDFFEPDYFNMAIEINLLYANNPTVWSDYLELHEFVYTELKQAYPGLPVFCSVSAQHLLPGYIGGNNVTQAREVLNQLLEHSDLYAISFYPYMSAFLGNPYPENSFDEILSLSDKPFAVAETGYPAQTFSMDIGNAIVTIEGSDDKQDAFIRDLLDAAASRENTQFVINFVVRDYDQLWVQIGSPIDINIAWRDTGFFDENGNERKSWSTWNEYLNIPYTTLN
jgi:hypothetical protein